MKQQIKHYIAKAGGLSNLKSIATAIVPLAFVVQLAIPQPVLAQTTCTPVQDTSDADGESTASITQNFKITCKGESNAPLEVNTQTLLGNTQSVVSGYNASQSKVTIDINEDVGTPGITIKTDAGDTILTGTITNDEPAPEDGSVSVVLVSPANDDPVNNGAPLYDVIFESQATISSEGNNRPGLSAWIGARNASDEAVLRITNSGTITTEGNGATGLSAGAAASANEANRVLVINSGTITTSGSDASGLSAYFELDDVPDAEDSADALGVLTASNSGTGTIAVEGNGTGGGFVTGLEAVYRTKVGNDGKIANSGLARVVNSGKINVSGNRAKGIYALTHGTGNVNITVNGTISAGHPGAPASEDSSTAAVPKKFGIGIHGKANTGERDPDADPPEAALPDSKEDVDVMILATGSGTSITAYGGATASESTGIGILAETGADTGHSKVTISSGATVSADSGTAVKFEGGKGTLVINNSGDIVGDVVFAGSGDNSMGITIGEDRGFQLKGDITGLTTLDKKGAGYARLGGDVTFRGESTLNLEDGALVIVGKMDLGSGEVTVHKAGRIVFEIGTGGSTGSIDVGSIHFDEIDADKVSVYAQLNDDLDLEDEDVATAARTGLTADTHELLNVNSITSSAEGSSTKEPVTILSIMTVKAGGESANVGSIEYANNVGTATFNEDTVDEIAKLNPGPPAPVTSGGDDDNNNAILGLGLVAVLVALYWGDGLFGSSFADDYAFNTPQSAYIASVDEASTLTLRETGNQPYQVWIRTGLEDTMQLAGVKNAGVSGTEIGLSLYRSDDFYIEASSAQDVAAQVNSLNQGAQGEVYALSSGWQNERYFAGIKLSYGDFDTDTVIDNPVVKSTLISQSEVRHTQAQFTAGTRWNTGNLMFTPSASVQAGTFDYSAHQAQGAVVNAEVPSYTQDYSALRVGLKMSASDWLSFSDNVKWKPHLQFDQIHTDSGSGGDVTLHQMDRLGALSFNSGASVQSMPEVVNAVSFGTSVKTSKSSQSEWKFGYAGLEADGEYYHAAVAAYQMKF